MPPPPAGILLTRPTLLKSLIVAATLATITALTAPPESGASSEISAEVLRDHVKWLAADAREGRGAGTQGLTESALYIEEAFRQGGISPGAPEGGYRQPFSLTLGVTVGEATGLVVGRTRLRMGADFLPLGLSDSGRVSGPLAFAGYGVRDPQSEYDDYAGLDVSGRVVVVLPGRPPAEAPPAVDEDPFRSWRVKAEEARAQGAVGLLALVRAIPTPAGPTPAEGGFDLGLEAALDPDAPAERPFLAAYVTREALAQAAWEAHLRIGAAEDSLLATRAPSSCDLGPAAATLAFHLHRRTAEAWNVVGRLPGSDPALAESPLLVGAHYDHLGRLPTGEIMNGADDNASGVAALLELARTLASSSHRRSIYLVAFAGEELGLLGSTHFVRHMPFPPERCLAMINLDTVGRPREGRLLLLGAGTAEEFPELISSSAVEGLDPQPVTASYGSSDQWPFARAGIPALQYFTGPHADYHQPTDNWEKLDYEGLARVTRSALELVTGLARREEPLTWAEPKEPVSAPGPGGPGASGGERAYLGSIPDFAYEGPGLRVSGVSRGGPAEGAGLEVGDVILMLGGDTVDNLMDLTAALRAHRAGEEVEVVFLRDGEEMKLRVTLTKRP